MTETIAISGNMQSLPLDQLYAWDANPRVRTNRETVDRLKANLRSGGLLQNLVAAPRPEGGHYVIAGASRLVALNELAQAGEIRTDEPIVCAVRDIDVADVEALRTALSENAVRQQMEPIDEAYAMAQMRRMGESVASIAAAFHLGTETVRRRLALGQLVPEAQDLIRARTRDLDWGKALSMADAATQVRICTDIEANAEAWKTGDEIRRFLTADTIPAAHALFDLARYEGRIIRDMFDGDKLVDREQFWGLQNEAIHALKARLEEQGYREVQVSHRPVDTLRFHRSEDPAQSIAIVEVAPNGKVTTHEGLVQIDDGPVVEPADQTAVDAGAVEIAPDGVRPTPAIADYTAAHRSAIVQAHLSDDFRSCLEITVAGLLGHRDLGMRAPDFRFPGATAIRTGAAFERVATDKAQVQETLTTGGVGQGGNRDHEILAMVQAMDDETLGQLFTRLVAGKVGQRAARRLDDDPNSLVHTYAHGLEIDVRASWTPDETFFSLMATRDLSRLAAALLPQDRQGDLENGSRERLARTLATSFREAAEGSRNLDRDTAARLNAWVPGGLSFPARFDLAEEETADAEAHAAQAA